MKFLTVLLLLSFFSSHAQNHCRPWHKTDSEIDGLFIGKIVYNVDNIFNSTKQKENKKFHRYSNKLHIKTKQRIIARELLFKEGDKLNLRLLQETKR